MSSDGPFDAEPIAEEGVSGAASALPAHAQIGGHLGDALTGVTAHFGPEATAACEALGALAYTVDDRIAFRDPSPSLALQAHEAAHVAQQADGPRCFGRGTDALEVEADAFAEHVAGPGSLPDRVTEGPTEGTRVLRFGTTGHRAAATEGLAGSFGAEEIGEIYAANWERDYAQGAAEYADMVLMWKEVKQYAPAGGPMFEAAAGGFRHAVEDVLRIDAMFDARKPSFGGSTTWSHVDNPGGADADERWGKQREAAKLPGHILDARAYVKDQMVEAVSSYRGKMDMSVVGDFDNWGGVAKPEGYGKPNPDARNSRTSRDVIAEEATRQAQAQKSAVGRPARTLGTDKAGFAASAQNLGRATHAVEDFFSHSQWLERAREMQQQVAAGKKPDVGAIVSGTFERESEIHAFGHKLLGIVTMLKQDFPLLLKVYGRSEASTKLDEKGHEKTRDSVMSSLRKRNSSMTGEGIDVALAARDAYKAIDGSKGKLQTADILTNTGWLSELEAKARHMIQKGDAAGGPESHANIAKDQDEGPSHDGHTKDFTSARDLAAAADRLVIAPLARIMKEQDGGAARDLLTAQLAVLDKVMAPPSPEHPLIGMVKVT